MLSMQGTLRVRFDRDYVEFVMSPELRFIEPLLERAKDFTKRCGAGIDNLSTILRELLENAVATAEIPSCYVSCTVQHMNDTLFRITVKHAKNQVDGAHPVGVFLDDSPCFHEGSYGLLKDAIGELAPDDADHCVTVDLRVQPRILRQPLQWIRQ